MVNKVTMPINIPEPLVNFTEELPAQPSGWSTDTEVNGYYYIDTTHSEATDTNRDFGTPNFPRRTLPQNLTAGSLIVIRGLYNRDQAGKTWLRCYGDDNPWSAGQRGKVYIDGGVNTDNPVVFTYPMSLFGSYFVVDGITLDKNKYISIGSSTAGYSVYHGVMRNSKLIGDGGGKTTAVQIGAPFNDPNSTVKHLVFYKNEVRRFGPWLANDADVDANGLNISGDIEKVWILDNLITETAGSGVQLSPGKPSVRSSSTRNIYLGRNEVSYCSQGGITGKYPTNIIISQNHLHHVYDRSWTPSKGIGMQYGPSGVWMFNNLIHDIRHGIRGAGTDSSDVGWDMYSIGNVIFNANRSNEAGVNFNDESPYNNAGAFVSQGYYNWYIANNLVFNSETFASIPSRANTYRIENNIISNMTEQAFFTESQLPVSQINHNILDGYSIPYRYNDQNYTEWSDFEEHVGSTTNIRQTLTVTEGKTLEEIVDILSVHPDLVDAGAPIPDYVTEKFFETFGYEMERGEYDKIIPQGLSRDIGPWEAGDLFVSIPPAAPTDLYIDVLESKIYWKSASLNATEFVIYKDGQSYTTVTAGETSLVIEGLCSNINTYSVQAVNGSGSSISDEISSSLIDAEIFNVAEIDTSKSYKLFRSATDDSINLTIEDISSTGDLFGIPYPSAAISRGDSSGLDGYVYSLAGKVLNGNIIGTGKVAIYISMSNYSDIEGVFDFSIDDTHLLVNLSKGYKQYKVNIEFSENLSYSFTSNDLSNKGHCGILAVAEE